MPRTTVEEDVLNRAESDLAPWLLRLAAGRSSRVSLDRISTRSRRRKHRSTRMPRRSTLDSTEMLYGEAGTGKTVRGARVALETASADGNVLRPTPRASPHRSAGRGATSVQAAPTSSCDSATEKEERLR